MNYPPPPDMLQIPGPSLIEHAGKDKTVRTAEPTWSSKPGAMSWGTAPSLPGLWPSGPGTGYCVPSTV